MKPLLPLAVLLAVAIAGCSKPAPDPYAKYRDVQLKRGMKIADLKQQFGEPDKFREWWNPKPDIKHNREYSDQRSVVRPHHVQELNYGAFGAHSQNSGHVTRHRLQMTFLDGELYEWEKSTPIGRD
jgi:hypothetical protein